MLVPGKLLQNRYRIVRPIGQGGMGAVYLATDERLGTDVALKETLFGDEWLRKAFEREARLLAGLHHASLPKVIDHFSEGKGQFLVMGFIPGEDLAVMLKLRGSAFPPSQVLNWADQLLDALDYLHTQEPPVVHRDIKPQNLKLTKRGQIILLDFGLAKNFASALTSPATGKSLLGYTRNYAPLEQIQGTGTDPLSDLYSLAGTLYHLVTGTAPPDALTRATSVLSGKADPLRLGSEVNREVPIGLAKVLHQALSLNPSLRPQNANIVRRQLHDIEEVSRVKRSSMDDLWNYEEPGTQFAGTSSELPPTVLSSTPAPDVEQTLLAQPVLQIQQKEREISFIDHNQNPGRRSFITISILIFIITIGAIFWWRAANNNPQRYAVNLIAGAGSPSSLRGTPVGEFQTQNDLYEVALSGDGKLLASIGDENRVRVWSVADRSQLRELTSDDYQKSGRAVAMSADGKVVAAGSDDGMIRLWEASSGKLLFSERAHADYVFLLMFSSDSQTLLSAGADKTVRLWRVSDGQAFRAMKIPGPDELLVAASPDQQTLALYDSGKRVRLWSISSGKQLQTLRDHQYEISSGAFSSDGQVLAIGSKDGVVRLWRTTDGTLLQTLKGPKGSVGSVVLTPDGQVLAAGWSDGSVRLWRVADGKLLTTLEGAKKIVQSLIFSTDGRLLLSGSDDRTIRLWQIAGD